MEKALEKLAINSFQFAGQRAAGPGVSPDEWIEDPAAYNAAACGVMAVLEALSPKGERTDGNESQA